MESITLFGNQGYIIPSKENPIVWVYRDQKGHDKIRIHLVKLREVKKKVTARIDYVTRVLGLTEKKMKQRCYVGTNFPIEWALEVANAVAFLAGGEAPKTKSAAVLKKKEYDEEALWKELGG